MSTPIHPPIQDGENPFLAKEDWPVTDHLITEDGKPLDNLYSERQMRLLVETLYVSWKPDFPFLACMNVGVFYVNENPPIVPDVFVSVNVRESSDIWSKAGRSYLQWDKGKPPDVVIEVVSNTEGGELTSKRRIYAENVRTPYYVVWDPELQLKGDRLQCFVLMGDVYQPTPEVWFPKLRLGLKVWHGSFDKRSDDWLRWIDAGDKWLETGEEQRIRAEAAEHRAKILAARLLEMGVDPDSLNGKGT